MLKLLRIVLFLFAFGAAASAQPKDPEGFEPVSGDMMQKGESIPATTLVAAAYGFIFAALMVYVASVWMRARRVEEEVASLRKKIEAKRG
jgi:hypothetical protein